MNQYSAKAVANVFLHLAKSEGTTIAPMKIQKLVYFANGWALGLAGQPLIQENVQAWKYGPVIEELYHEFKRFGSGPITQNATNVSLDPSSLQLIEEAPQIPDSDEDAHALIRKIWDVYGKFSGPQLSNLTHKSDTPWDKTYNGSHQQVIPNKVIQEYFKIKADAE